MYVAAASFTHGRAILLLVYILSLHLSGWLLLDGHCITVYNSQLKQIDATTKYFLLSLTYGLRFVSMTVRTEISIRCVEHAFRTSFE